MKLTNEQIEIERSKFEYESRQKGFTVDRKQDSGALYGSYESSFLCVLWEGWIMSRESNNEIELPEAFHSNEFEDKALGLNQITESLQSQGYTIKESK